MGNLAAKRIRSRDYRPAWSMASAFLRTPAGQNFISMVARACGELGEIALRAMTPFASV